MSLIVIDFETFYTDNLGFRTQTTEEYLRDTQFEVIGVAVQVDDGEPVWFSGSREEIRKWLRQFDWKNSMMLAHNTMFDGAILGWFFSISPMKYLDTLCMARALHGVDAGGSLAKLAERYKVGAKGTEVVDAKGKRRTDFTPEDLARYGEYCKNDVRLTYELFKIMSKGFPIEEFALVDMTLRMFIHPRLYVDENSLQDRLDDLRTERSQLLLSLKERLGASDEEEVRKKLSSNKQFADVLRSFNIEVPTKISPTTSKETYALAKKDEGFLALTEHDDPFIQQLCAVRLGTKSTLEEKRIERFINIGRRNHGRIPIPLKYYGAHTGRWSGTDKVNFQNLPSRDPKKKALKKGIVPPEGYVVINSDSSQIEARVLAWLAGQEDVVKQFANKEDAYSIFASSVYNRTITKADPTERFVGKTCISEGTLVLSNEGWKPIESITTEDKLWDGEEWVCHQGLLNNGIKPTLNLCGAWLTPDHLVWSGTQWLEAQSAVSDADTLYRVLDTGAENLPSQAMWLAHGGVWPRLSYAATATRLSTRLTKTTSKISAVLDALFAPRQQRLRNAIGYIAKQCRTTSTGLAYSIASLRQSHAAIHQLAVYSNTTAGAVSMCIPNGEATALRSCGMFKPLTAGTNLISRWIGSMWTVLTRRGIYVSYRVAITSATSARSRTWRNVYDILNCGSRNRFTILTEAGPVIVHNCILGLGYGTGAPKLRHTLATSQPVSVSLEEEECKRIVDLYRQKNDRVTALWAEGDSMISALMNGKFTRELPFGLHGCVWYDADGLILPNDMRIRYPNLRREDEDGKTKNFYDSRKGRVSIWGGSVVENVVQALARIIVGQQMVRINEHYPVALTVHDAAVVVVPESEAQQACEVVSEIMSVAPDWAPGLPVACEAKVGATYGDC